MNKKATSFYMLGIALLVVGFIEFISYYLLQDRKALTSSIYTYYFDTYYLRISSGKIPWIGFNFEYPPLAAYALLFPGYAPGLSVLSLTTLRAFFCLLCSSALLYRISKSNAPQFAKTSTYILIGVTSIIVPGFFFGLFDWYLIIANIMVALSINSQLIKRSKIWTWIAIGSVIKLMPLLSIPFLISREDLSLKSEFSKVLSWSLLLNLPFLIFGFHGFKVFVSYHRMRSIDVFSSYACILNTLQNLGLTNIDRKWNFGALEVQGSMSQIFSKISLPIFGISLVGMLALHAKYGRKMKSGFAIYLSSIILYTVLSKVSQNNYVIWAIAAVAGVWLVGYDRPQFIKQTSIVSLLLLLIGFFQDRFFDDFTMPNVTWRMILVCSFRHVLSIVLVYLILKEVKMQHFSEPEVQTAALVQ